MNLQFGPLKFEQIMLRGGLDLITPTLSLPPGVARPSINFEPATTGGYTRIKGYERYDGHTAPSSATYQIQVVSGAGIPAVGATVTGASSGATGVLIASTSTTFVLTKITGTFTTEVLQVGGTPVGTRTGTIGASTQSQHAQYLALAANSYRSDISAPPGSGPLRGAFIHNDITYAFRDNAGATACVLYKATASGWTAVAFQYEISFTAGGNIAPADGATLTQGGVTATVQRVMRQAGAWVGAPGTASGRLIITAPSGGNFAAGAATLSGGVNVTLSGVQTAITMLPGGKFDVITANFAGDASTVRAYGCDGVNRAWEFDGTVFAPITTGTTPDTPKFIEQHKHHLFLAIGSSVLHSAPGLPYDYTATTASEIATGDTVTGLLVQPGSQTTGTITIFQETTTLMLYGTGTSSWNLVTFNTGTGAMPWSAQNMAQSFFLDNRGVFSLDTSLTYGNFDQTSLTPQIQPMIAAHRSALTCSTLCREKSQYRLYFSDGLGLHLTLVNGKNLGVMPVQLAITGGVYNAWEGVRSNGDAVIYLCGADGMLYEAEKGTSFDGAPIPYALTLHHDSIRSPRVLKRYRKCAVEITGSSYVEVGFYYSLGYGKSEYASYTPVTYSDNLLSSTWDASTWDTFFWDSSNLTPIECEMTGTAENVALSFAGNSDLFDSFTINSAIIHYTPRRALR